MTNRRRSKHIPVLLKEVIEGLRIDAGKKYIDATVGGAGHAREIVKKGGILLAIDRDPEAVRWTNQTLKVVETHLSKAFPDNDKNVVVPAQSSHPNFKCVVANFRDLKATAEKYGFSPSSGILFDLGVSSDQLSQVKKGLSFMNDGPLDMRLDSTLTRTAADIINQSSEDELYEIFTRFSQEELARPFAAAIIRARRLKSILTTRELAQIIEERSGGRIGAIHPATKVFLALRIAVNHELENLQEGIVQAIDLLEPKGRLVVISFHETEDRIVKRIFKKKESQGRLTILSKKPVRPTQAEIRKNPRSRSARMRLVEHIL